MAAIWLPVVGYEGIYLVSYGGYIKNAKTGKRLKYYKNEDNYLCVTLIRNGRRRKHKVHRIVAIAHIPNPELKTQVNHKYGKKWDCRASQLEWNTQSENILHAWQTGLRKSKKGCKYNTDKQKRHGRHKPKKGNGRDARRYKKPTQSVAKA